MAYLKKIVIRIKGGVGNQLFIYAFALTLQTKFNQKVYLERYSGFVIDTYKRKYKLDNFDLELQHSSLRDTLFLILRFKSTFLSRLLFRRSLYLTEEDYSEKKIGFLIDNNYDIYLDGYWQHNHFFNRNLIQKSISFKYYKNYKNIFNFLLNDIANSESVAIHIRRVNYKDKLPLEYYLKAIAEIKNKIDEPFFFVFSDDILWAKANLSFIRNINYVENGLDDEIAELWLMSQCKHFIIANSSFSWWGSFLSKNLDKKIISSKFTPSGSNINVLFDENWSLID